MLRIDLHNRARMFIDSRDLKHQKQIVSKVFALADGPSPNDSEKLIDSTKGESRATVGEYRIVYWTDDSALHVTAIGKRSDGQVYRRRK